MYEDPQVPRMSGAFRASPPAGASFLVAMIARELASAASEDQSHGFYVAVGHRIAAVVPLDDVEDLGTMTARINALWAALGWGSAVVTVEDSAIVVRHDGLYPDTEAEIATPWKHLLPPLMEGTYETWFRMMGSSRALGTSARWIDRTLEIRHGR